MSKNLNRIALIQMAMRRKLKASDPKSRWFKKNSKTVFNAYVKIFNPTYPSDLKDLRDKIIYLAERGEFDCFYKSNSQYKDINNYVSYGDYLNSETWRKKRIKAFRRDKFKCIYCGGNATQVHHKIYPKEWGSETIRLLVSICSNCHKKLHEIST